MFPRRRTDQVYATLQQAQRRITEQGGSAAAPPPAARIPTPLPGSIKTPLPGSLQTPLPGSITAPPQGSPGTAALQRGRPPSGQTAAPGTERKPRLSGQPPTTDQIPSRPLPPPITGPGPGVTLSGPLLSLLVLVWVLTLVIMFLVGRASAGRAAGAGYAPGEAGWRAPQPAAPVEEPAAPAGRWILICRSEPRVTPERRKAFQDEAVKLNEVMRKMAARGWKPWFSVREPPSGQLQLAFGYADGRWGVNRRDWEELDGVLRKPHVQGGANYASAQWIELK